MRKIKSKLLCIGWAFTLLGLWTIGQIAIFGFLLLLSVILLFLSMVFAGYVAGKFQLQGKMTGCNHGENRAMLVLWSDYRHFVPVRFSTTIFLQNLLTGEEEKISIDRLLFYGNRVIELELHTAYCGKLYAETETIKLGDLFGIAKIKTKLHRAFSCLLLPESAGVYFHEELPFVYDRESDTYADDKAGDNLSQVFSLREYRNGDRIHAVHWKLTGKSDTLIVKEGSLPINRRILLLVESTYISLQDEQAKQAIEKTLSNLISLTQHLLDQGISHHIGWWEASKQTFRLAYVEDTENFLVLLPELLSMGIRSAGNSILEVYQKESEETYSSVIVVNHEQTETHYL